MNLEK